MNSYLPKQPLSESVADEYIVRLRHYLQTIAAFPEPEWQMILPRFRAVSVQPHYLLQQAKRQVTHHYYLVSGLVRLFYETLDGKDVNKCFYGAGHIVGNLSALVLNQESRFAIETLEPCVLVEIDLAGFEQLTECSPGLKAVFNHSCQLMLVRNERREAELLTMSAKQRFLQFHNNFPDLFDRIPQYHIASYLGITPVALSRYKKQWLEAEG